MMHICTTCDHKYIHKGLALYQSLKNTMPDGFTLHWLCGDDIIYYQLDNLKLPNVILYRLSELEDINPELLNAKNNPKSNYGDQYSQYCWTQTPWFIHYLLYHGRGEINQLLYADSDIFFYESPKLIADVVGNRAVGIHTHRFSGRIEDFKGDNGWYNVGVMLFNNTPAGINIAATWKGWLLDIHNPFYETHGTCGDQPYLMLFEKLFGWENVCVFDEHDWNTGDDTIISHQAPWCPDPIPAGKRRIFYHFSHFQHDFATNTWKDHQNATPEWTPSSWPEIRKLYQDYYDVIKKANTLIQSAPVNMSRPCTPSAASRQYEPPKPAPTFQLDIIGNIKVDESKPERIKMLLASIRSLKFLKNNCKFRLLLEGASQSLMHKVRCEMSQCGFDFILFQASFGGYGKSCMNIIKSSRAPYVMNFLEDHFCMLDSVYKMDSILETMEKYNVDLLKTSFFQVEQNSYRGIEPFYSDTNGFIFDKDIVSQGKYQKHYGQRYFISVHFIATQAFAKKFWDRDLGPRPHEYEFPKFVPGWEHRVMVPAVELLCSADDDHGEPGTALLNRPDAKKFWDIYNTL